MVSYFDERKFGMTSMGGAFITFGQLLKFLFLRHYDFSTKKSDMFILMIPTLLVLTGVVVIITQVINKIHKKTVTLNVSYYSLISMIIVEALIGIWNIITIEAGGYIGDFKSILLSGSIMVPLLFTSILHSLVITNFVSPGWVPVTGIMWFVGNVLLIRQRIGFGDGLDIVDGPGILFLGLVWSAISYNISYVKDIDSEINDVKVNIKNEEKTKEQIDKDIQTYTDTKNKSDVTINNKNDEIKKLKNVIDDKKKTIEKYNHTIDTREDELEDASDDIFDTRKKLKNNFEIRSANRNYISKKETEINGLNVTIGNRKNTLEKHQNEENRLKILKTNKQQKLRDVNQEKQRLTNELKRLEGLTEPFTGLTYRKIGFVNHTDCIGSDSKFYTCYSKDDNQKFRIKNNVFENGKNNFKLQSVKNGKCFTKQNTSNSIIMDDCSDDNQNQQFVAPNSSRRMRGAFVVDNICLKSDPSLCLSKEGSRLKVTNNLNNSLRID